MRRTSVLIAAALILLSACGSDDSNDSSSATTVASESTTSTTVASATAPLVTTKQDATLGTILADAQGKTLYTLTSNGQAVACNSACASAWPPLDLPAGVTTPTGASGVSGLGTAAGANGATQVTSGGLPLYRFSGDKDSSTAAGEGISSFGGVWHVVKVTAAPASSSTSVTTATPTTQYRY